MRSRVLAVLLLVGLSYNLLAVAPRIANWRLPGDQQDYEPEQPLAYSHRLHAGDLQVPCLYCHFGAERSRHAGIPPANVCMNCHRSVTAPLGAIRAEDEAAARGEARAAPHRERRTARSSTARWASTTSSSPTRRGPPGRSGG